MCLQLMPIAESDREQYIKDMQEAFLLGAMEGGFPPDTREILPESDIDRSLNACGAVAYKAMLNGEMVGGAILVLDRKKRYGHLDFLYVKHAFQNRGIGAFLWFAIERLHPDIRVWETCTPCFETILISQDGERVESVPFRKETYSAQAPQSFYLQDILAAHDQVRAMPSRYDNLVDSCTLIRVLGKSAHMVPGNRGNIKVTTPEDVYVFRALLTYRENEQAFGLGLTDHVEARFNRLKWK